MLRKHFNFGEREREEIWKWMDGFILDALSHASMWDEYVGGWYLH